MSNRLDSDEVRRVVGPNSLQRLLAVDIDIQRVGVSRLVLYNSLYSWSSEN